MITIINWIKDHGFSIVIPLIILLLLLMLTFWFRKMILYYLSNHISHNKPKSFPITLDIVRGPSALWCIIFSIYISFYISALTPAWKVIVGRILWSILLFSMFIPIFKITSNIIRSSGQVGHISEQSVLVLQNVARITLVLVMSLIALEIWGISTNLLLLILTVIGLAAILAFPDVFPNFFSGLQLSANQQIKPGDYIKLGDGKEGYVIKIGWNKTLLQTSTLGEECIPNAQLLQHTVINCGRPLKRVQFPFRFYAQKTNTEPIGVTAGNIKTLAERLVIMPDEVIYCHTYRCLEENPSRLPDTANDFACWAKDVLKDPVLAQQLGNVHSVGIVDLAFLRENLVAVLKNYIDQHPYQNDVTEGNEFCFVKAECVVNQTVYVAYDLREMAEALRKIPISSLFCHLVGPKLRSQSESNDFSKWLSDSLGEAELAHEVELINPYIFTPGGLRIELITIIEKHIK